MPTRFPILLVDDDPTLIDLLRLAAQATFLEADFNQVHSALEARQYFSELEGSGPQLLLLDLNLGNSVSGLDLLKELRAHPSTYLLRIVILTVSDLPADVQASYQVGASSFTRKPETFEAWKVYVEQLRTYWLGTVTLPPIRYSKRDWELS